ncbi:hypothetical protein BDF20DRAFT_827984 [Mycotypha africana]|uniref:uncharacterized protein n=1 Tax=Mycotypha africana TaxID=64632 RepID=UPI002301AD2E|nr:uncharacterized protein BDF20DRAFT_827984 [Mycotypha africana]KAI8968517.1 hypothetical protein BDF20DRAFT_827984 [Mycotypha africana]
MPRRGPSLGKLASNTRNKNSTDSNRDSHQLNEMTITASDFSGPFYSISDVLDDSVSMNTSNGVLSNANGSEPTHTSPTPGAARRNVNEADVVVTSGGVSMPIRRRSTTLPPKDPQEEKKHLQEYEFMMKQAKKLEAKKQKELHRKKEEKDKKMNHAIHIWETDIIPHWKTRVKDKRTRNLWDQGIPPRCRRKAWQLSIGNQLNVSKTTFAECTRRIPRAIRASRKKVNEANQQNNIVHNGVPHTITADIHNNGSPYMSYTDSPLYSIHKQRRTSSLDVLREPKMDSDSKGSSVTGDYVEDDELRENGHYAGFTNFTNASFNEEEANSSIYSFTSRDEPLEDDLEEGIHSGRAALELQAEQSQDDAVINLDGEYVDDDDNTISSQEEIVSDKTITDPAVINFLNKAIDEDILRTLPSLCVFQVINSISMLFHHIYRLNVFKIARRAFICFLTESSSCIRGLSR